MQLNIKSLARDVSHKVAQAGFRELDALVKGEPPALCSCQITCEFRLTPAHAAARRQLPPACACC